MTGRPGQPGGLTFSQGRGIGAESNHARRPPHGNRHTAGAGIATARGGEPVGRGSGGFGRAGLRRGNGLASRRAVDRDRPDALVNGDAIGVGAVPAQGCRAAESEVGAAGPAGNGGCLNGNRGAAQVVAVVAGIAAVHLMSDGRAPHSLSRHSEILRPAPVAGTEAP